MVIWPLVEKDVNLFTIPLSLLLISAGWWENFVSDDSPIPALAKFGRKVNKFENSRYFAYIFISVWKCVLFLGSVVVILYIREGNYDFLFSNFKDAFMDHTINITEVCIFFCFVLSHILQCSIFNNFVNSCRFVKLNIQVNVFKNDGTEAVLQRSFTYLSKEIFFSYRM